MEKIMKKKSRMLLFFLFIFFGLILTGYFNLIFAQTEKKKKDSPQEIIKNTSNTSAYDLFKKKKDCVENFNINSLNFKDPRVIQNSYLLTEFFLCEASIKDNINECDKLSVWPNQMEACKSYFNQYQGVFGRLIRDQRLTPQIIYTWTTELKIPREDIPVLPAIINKDISYCEKSSNPKHASQCKAVITGDIKYCLGEEACENKVQYIKALENGDTKECEKIKNPSIKLMCKAYMSMDEKICEANKGYKDFCDSTCEATLRR